MIGVIPERPGMTHRSHMHERVHITRNGREYVVLIAAEDLESIEATLELLGTAAKMTSARRQPLVLTG